MFYNFWLKRREAKFRGFKNGDYVFFDRTEFDVDEWNDLIDKYGPYPMVVVDTFENKYGTKYLVVEYDYTKWAEITIGELCKVDDDFMAERM